MYRGKMNLEERLWHQIEIQDAARVADVFGIEVELEGQNIFPPPEEVLTYWTHHKDGSLRVLNPGDQAIEYVSRVPYDLTNTEKAVSTLFRFLNKPSALVYDSYRTSIHVHVNCGMESYRTIYNFIALSIMLDELFVSQNGEHRIGNNFCLRTKDAMGQVVNLTNSIIAGNAFFGIGANERYCSVNFASLIKFGSIEFRSLECTVHEGRLMHWIGTLQQLKDKAKTYTNPIDIVRQYSALGPQAFLVSVLGPFAYKYLKVPGMENMLHNGMRIVQDYAFCSAWKE